MQTTRRGVIAASGTAALLGLAGCLGRNDGDEVDGYAMFFPLYDWAEQVSGGELTFTEPVGTGRMGHGFSPPGTITTDVARSDVFLYLDSAEFSWAQDLVATLEHDGEDVHIVNLLEAVEGHLLDFDGHDDGHGHDDHDDDHGHDDGHGHDDHGDDHGHDDGHGHDDHGDLEYDPHVWVDPVLAQQLVGTVADALADVDPENAEHYHANAEEYTVELERIDAAFESLVQDGERETVVFAGHDSFGYLENRYGIEFVTPTGVSPDADASPDDIANLIETIEDHDLDTVLYDSFEAPGTDDAPQLVDLIFENSNVDTAEPLTPIEGTTAEWQEEGWGWIEQMENVNVPALERALNPE